MLNLKKLTLGVAFLFFGSLVGIPLASFFFTAPIKIGGDLYQKIAHEKDLLAATVPPDMYVIETHYSVAHTMIKVYKDLGSTSITDYTEVKRLIAQSPKIQEDYQKAYEYFVKSHLSNPELLSLVESSDKHVRRYFELLNDHFLPILNTGDTVRIKAQFDLMVLAFEAHRGAIEALLPKIHQQISVNEASAQVIQKRVLFSVVGLALGLLALGLLIVWAAYKVSVKPLLRIAREIHEGTEESRHAAVQMTHASQNLAQGASEQAAAIEETSASLEEVSSMIHSTANNADQAKQLATETRASAQDGVRNMIDMTTAMAAIEKSSSDVAKIVKSIDEIAFQTNILALNAAVEAARAGEAGAGFAVVADEVRSLAQRSAMAAHESAEKIEASMKSSRLGAVSLQRVQDSLGLIETKITKTDALVAEITMAAREQAQGIEHISIAIEQMNKVAQETAESASQIAHSAELTQAQAQNFEELVARGVSVVGFSVRKRSVSKDSEVSNTRSRVSSLVERTSRQNPNSSRVIPDRHIADTLTHERKPKLGSSGRATEHHFKDF